MMEEVCDDTNGESTFEFVDNKSEEILPKDSSSQDWSNDRELQSSVAVPSMYQHSATHGMQYPVSTESLIQSVPEKAKEPVISFYDPAQYSSANTVLMAPIEPPPIETLSLSSPVSSAAAAIEKQFDSTQQNSQISVAPQFTQSPPLTQQAYPTTTTPFCAVPLPGSEVNNPIIPQEVGNESGVWGWIRNTQFLNKVAEKAKNSVDSVITTLDPGMKEIINTGGDISVIVASGNEAKVSAVREAFQLVFGKATVQGIAVQSSSIAPQPVGFSAGLKAAEERIGNLRQQGFLQGNHVLLGIESFITELTPENWYDIGCLLLQDFTSGISLQVYTEAIPISSHFVAQAKDQTTPDFPLGWSGYAVTIGQIIGPALGVHHSEWHQALTGVSRREILFLAAKTIAGMYKAQLRR